MIRNPQTRAVGGGLVADVVLNFVPGMTLVSPLLGSIVAGYLYGGANAGEPGERTLRRIGLTVVAVLLPVALLVPPVANPELFPATAPIIATSEVINGGLVRIGYPDTYAGFATIYVVVTTFVFAVYGLVGGRVGGDLSQSGPQQFGGHT